QEGIIVAGILSKIKKVPCIFYSLEIVAKEDIAKRKPVGRLLLMTKKFMESYFSREANITVVQDKYRASILTRDNAIDRKKIFIVPNSYYFTSRRDISYDVDYLQIPANKKIIIYTGSVIPEMAIKDIIKSIDLWPKETLFMLHTPYRTIYLERIKQFIKENNLEHKVLVSIKRLSFEELCSLINKAHIGIALYKPVNKNYYLTPSGKVSFYLAQGIPIIVNDVPLLKEFVSKYKCGMYIEKAKEIGNAVKVILKDYPSFSVNAKICYQQELKFSRYL
ncbi:unnamed protein product, partial [marine sediment metagenome]